MSGERTESRQLVARDVWLAAGLAVLLVAGGLGWLLVARPRRIAPAQPIPIVPSDVQLRLGKVRLQGVSDGKVLWEVEAEHFDFAKNRPLLRITGIKKVAILHDGAADLTLTADVLERNTLTGEISVSGNLVVAGDRLQVRVPFASWNPFTESLRFPRDFTAQFGDFSLTCGGAMLFDVKAGTLAGDGGVVITTRGGTLRADRVVVNAAAQQFTLDQASADLEVAELAAWAAGHPMPTIPEIPASIRERYARYLKNRAKAAPGTGG